MNNVTKDILMHYGMPRRSGRYPWGSGENPFQHEGDFISRVDELRAEKFEFTDEKGKTWTGDTAIAKSMGLSTTQFRTQLSLAKDERRAYDVATAKALREKGSNLITDMTIKGATPDELARAVRHSITFFNELSDINPNSDDNIVNGGVNTWDDWHLIPKTRPVINPPCAGCYT